MVKGVRKKKWLDGRLGLEDCPSKERHLSFGAGFDDGIMCVAVKEVERRQQLIKQATHALGLLRAPGIDYLLGESPAAKKLRLDGKQLQVRYFRCSVCLGVTRRYDFHGLLAAYRAVLCPWPSVFVGRFRSLHLVQI